MNKENVNVLFFCIGMIIGSLTLSILFGYFYYDQITASDAYNQGWNTHKEQTDILMQKAQSIVNECADMSIQVIDERDVCYKKYQDLNGCVLGNSIIITK